MTPLQALQTSLAGEHAALYVYGVLGARVSLSAEPELSNRIAVAYRTHRGRRDQLTSMIRAADTDPVVSEVSYELPNPALTAAQLRRAALLLESRCTAGYADLVARTSGAHRQWAINALTDSAVRQLGFGGRPDAFPGVAEL